MLATEVAKYTPETALFSVQAIRIEVSLSLRQKQCLIHCVRTFGGNFYKRFF